MGKDAAQEGAIESHLQEQRRFPPSAAFAQRAAVDPAQETRLRRRAAEEPDAFWAEVAGQLQWDRPFRRVREGTFPDARWFADGTLNAAVNCVDRHLQGPRRNKAAILWEGEDGSRATLTYLQLHEQVSRAANVLRERGVDAGDRVVLYLPLIPEAVVAMLACARIGAVHSVVFGGFSATALRERIADAGAVAVITADGGYRRGGVVPLKANVDVALSEGCPSVRDVLVVRRTGAPLSLVEGRDRWWHEALAEVPRTCQPVSRNAEDPLFILYTSGTTGRPKGIVHCTGGYLAWVAATTAWVFDLRDDDTYWCTADIGWITGHSYVVYGPLALGATVLLYEGAPDFPDRDRVWGLVARHQVTVLYTAPTAIRAFMKWGPAHPARHDRSSLRLLGTVGEPINPEAWSWYHSVIGNGRCPIVDTWWQTETGGILISPLPGVTTTVPGSATTPLPGISTAIVDSAGRDVQQGEGGLLVITQPWPSLARGIWGDRERFLQTYFSRIRGVYLTGDGARIDAEGYHWVMGRVDDVINVSGHRLGTAEIESALVAHPSVAEAAVVGTPHELTGEAVAAFVTLKADVEVPDRDALLQELSDQVVHQIGALARPCEIHLTEGLPKTRSGKIMRRLLRDLAAGRQVQGDTSTLEDRAVLERLREQEERPGSD